MRFKSIAGVILITIGLLVVIETICYIMADDTPFLWDFSTISAPVEVPKSGFNEIDPLLGYAKTEKKLHELGFKTEKGCMVLYDPQDTGTLMHILITGGSTSDLSLYPDVWPIELHKTLKAHGYHVKLYCAAVGGYNSGQEVLKLIRDGIGTDPVIHISYSGANDFDLKSYVSEYEHDFYAAKLNKGVNASWLMPSTVFCMRNLMRLNNPGIALRPKDSVPGADFWEENMRLMHGIAVEHRYEFVGLLQPVLGGSKYDQKMPTHYDSVEEYKERYPKMKKTVAQYPDFLTDLSGIFDTCHKGDVFMDYCHIHEEYQQLVAENVYNVLIQRKLLK